MSGHSTHPDQAAVDWLLTLCDRGADPRTVEEWAGWMEQDPAHARAFERTRELWLLSADLDWSRVEAARTRARRKRLGRRPVRYRWLATVAACAALLVVGVALLRPDPRIATDAPGTAVARYETGIGEVRDVVLEDGSSILLGAASRVEAGIGPDARRMRLLEGSAEFNVALDPARPFVVEARYLQALALGTRFRVHQRADRSVVEVAGGRVRVTLAADGTSGADRVELGPGDAAMARPDAVRVVQRSAPTEPRPWSGSEMLYRNEPLSNLVADLNRHAAQPLRLSPEVDADTPISGRWRLDGQGERVQALLAAVGLEAEPRGEVLLLRPRRARDAVD